MADFPFPIPKSLATYVDQFEDDPEKATEMLKSHLKKRGLDSTGHFFLAFFYFKRGMQEEAMEHAIKAKTFAPGSPLMENLPYFFNHPDGLNAWLPSREESSFSHYSTQEQVSRVSASLLDLDKLIAELSQIETKKITPDQNEDVDTETDLSERSSKVDDIVSETLANIHENQGRYKLAIQTYEKLTSLYPSKQERYQEQISRLRKKLSQYEKSDKQE